jgi:hypothetical protein
VNVLWLKDRLYSYTGYHLLVLHSLHCSLVRSHHVTCNSATWPGRRFLFIRHGHMNLQLVISE